MIEPLGQFRSDLFHEGFDVLRQRCFALPLVELRQTALLALENVAMNAVRSGLRVGRLQCGDQIEVVAVDLLQRRHRVPPSASCEYTDQQPQSGQRAEASPIARKLHEVRMKRQIRYLETLHLSSVEYGLAAGVEFFDQSGECRGDRAEVANLRWRRAARSDGACRQTFERFPHFEQFPDVVPVERDHHHAARGDRFEQSLADQLSDRFPRRGAADPQFLGNGDVRNRLPSAQLSRRDLALNVVVGNLTHRAG